MSKTWLWIVVTASTAPACAADIYPTRPIRLIVPYGAGGNADILGRLVGARLAEAFGQTVIIDNRPGASGLLGSEIQPFQGAKSLILLRP